jgi:hypothetical protein
MASWSAARMTPSESAAPVAREGQAPRRHEAQAPPERAADPPRQREADPLRQRHGDPPREREAPALDPDRGLRALGRDALARAGADDPGTRDVHDGAGRSGSKPEADAAEDSHPTVDLARVAWLVTVLSCLLAVTILALQGYVGYAGVTLAVALAAAINLF